MLLQLVVVYYIIAVCWGESFFREEYIITEDGDSSKIKLEEKIRDLEEEISTVHENTEKSAKEMSTKYEKYIEMLEEDIEFFENQEKDALTKNEEKYKEEIRRIKTENEKQIKIYENKILEIENASKVEYNTGC